MKRKIFSKLLMGAFLIASVSMFVSCKDYDDDINKNAADIAALKAQLGTDISGLKSDLTTQLASVNSQISSLKSSIDAKANADDLAKGLATKADAKELTDLIARVAVLETQIAKLSEIESSLAGKADASAVEELKGQLEAINGKIDGAITENKVNELIQAALATLEIQEKATAVFDSKINEALAPYLKAADLNGELAKKGYLTKADLAELETAAAKLDSLLKNDNIKSLLSKELMGKDEITQAISDSLTTKFQTLNDAILKVSGNLSAIEIFIKKQVTSVVLKPDFYWEGLEAIETPFLKTPEFVENGKYDFKYTVRRPTLGDRTIEVHVDNTMAWLATDGTKLSSETDKTWSWYIYNRKPSPTSSTAYTYFSLIEADGVAYAKNQKKSLQYVTIAPDAVAKYHVNPWSADLSDAKYSFYQNTAEVYTRGDASIKATPIDSLVAFDKKEGILTVPFSVEYSQVWNYFKKWAFENNTEAPSMDETNPWSLYDWSIEPKWDDAHGNNYTWVNWSTGEAIDKDGNVIPVITDIQYGSGYGKASAYGSSNYYDSKGNFVQEVAKLPFISLNVATDTLVNSDYAVVVPATYTIVALADNKPNTTLDKNTFVNNHTRVMNQIRDNHLYETVGVEGTYDYAGEAINYTYNSPGAIPSPATHDVGYRDTIDLKPFIETHYSYTTYTRYGQSTVDKIMTAELMEKLGLHYEFKKIDYTIGKNVTSESAHIQQIGDKFSGKFAPRSVKETDGTTFEDQEATREVIDREPLVRVDLVTRDGKIIRYGYIKLRITEAKQSLDDLDVEVELSDYYMNCGDQMRLTWYQVERLILAKLNGGNGMTKQEFEQNYYFMNEGGYTDMPRNSFGRLYATADANKVYGTRWYRDADGKIVEAADATTEADAVNTFDYQKWTADNNWFGRVWYTPHDNATTAHDWDEQTNVLIWDLHGYLEETEISKDAAPDYYRGNMKDLYTDVNLFERLIKVADATYKNKGLNKNAISTIVRFKNKFNDTYVNVKLIIPVGKLHFEYGAVDNKDWAHWYKFNAADPGVKDDTEPYWKEFDAHINPFKPSNNGYNFLDVTSYNQLLTDNWLDPTQMVVLEEKDKFSKFQTPNAPVVSFIFTTPQKDVNSKTVSATNGEWDVLGASGTKWTLKLGAHNGVDNTAIFAVKKNGKAYGPEEVCYLDDQLAKVIDGKNTVIAKNNRIHYHGLETAGLANLYPAATDLVNKVGAYKENGDSRFTLGNGLNNMKTAEYLDENVDKTFTAYLKLEVAHDLCYDPLIGKNLFNIRVHRPINIAAKEYQWDDRVLADNRLAIKDLIEIVDWNRFAVVPFGNSEIKNIHTIFDITQPAYSAVYASPGKMKQQNDGIPYEYYGISELAVRYDEIRTDHAKQPDIRSNKYYDEALIVKNTDLVKSLNSLTSWRETGLKTLSLLNADGSVVPFDVEHAYNHSDYNAAAPGNTSFGWLYYNNNASNVQEFHIYVPIAVKYNWGNIAYDYLLDAAGKKLDNDYTQTVWAIITVKGTH